MLVSDRRAPAQHLVGMVVRRLVDHSLEATSVPGHDDVRKQGQGSRDGAKLLCRAAVFRGDHPVMDGALQAMNRLALIEQIEHFRAEYWVAEIVAEIEGAEQPAQRITGFVDGIAGSG